MDFLDFRSCLWRVLAVLATAMASADVSIVTCWFCLPCGPQPTEMLQKTRLI